MFEPCDLRGDLAAVDALATQLWTEDAMVADVCGDLFHAGGKRLRPALVLLAARFASPCTPARIELALATELLHVATLLHDDIVDDATSRRHRPSANARWGDAIATYAGAYLFAKATELFASAGAEIDRIVSETICRVWRGQAREVESSHSLEVDEASYLAIAGEKTGALYELACRLGAVAAGLAEQEVAALGAFGRDFGVAFQVVDDVLDIAGDEDILGKRPGSDLRGGVYTLPIIFAVAEADDDARRLRALLARERLADVDVTEALAILRGASGLQRAASTAASMLDRARSHLAALPPIDARHALNGLTEYVFTRLHFIPMNA